MASKSVYILALFLSHAAIVSGGGIIGVNYGRMATNLISPPEVVDLIKNAGVTHVRINDVDHGVLCAFSNSGMELIVGLVNEQICQAATDQSFTDHWVATNIKPFYPATNITAISVGNDVIKLNPELNTLIVPAMRNLHRSLQKCNLDCFIKVSSAFPFYDLMAVYDPPSSGSFRPDLIKPVMRPLLDFLHETSSYMMLNIFPFMIYSQKKPKDNSIKPAIANRSPISERDPSRITEIDPKTHYRYRDILEQGRDAFGTAGTNTGPDMDNPTSLRTTRRGLAQDNARRYIKVVVTETGWPSLGNGGQQSEQSLQTSSLSLGLVVGILGSPPPAAPATPVKPSCGAKEIGANKANAEAYNGNLVNRVLSGRGTPAMPDQPLVVYIYSLFNEDQRKGNVSEQNYGLFYPNGEKVYDVSLTGCN